MRFKIFVGACLVLIVLLLVVLISVIVYTDLRVSRASKDASDKVTTFTQDVNNINSNLQNLNTQLQSVSQATGRQ